LEKSFESLDSSSLSLDEFSSSSSLDELKSCLWDEEIIFFLMVDVIVVDGGGGIVCSGVEGTTVVLYFAAD